MGYRAPRVFTPLAIALAALQRPFRIRLSSHLTSSRRACLLFIHQHAVMATHLTAVLRSIVLIGADQAQLAQHCQQMPLVGATTRNETVK